MSFGKILASTASKAKTVTVTNVGKVAATIGVVTPPAAAPPTNFTLADHCSGVTLAPKGKCKVGVTFTPFEVKSSIPGALMIPYGGTLNVDVALSGDGTPVTLSGPKSASFRTTAQGAIGTPSKKVTITNRTAVTVMLDDGTVGADFNRIAGEDLCANATLASKAKCTVMVAFTPQTGTPPGPVSESLSYGFTYGGPPAIDGNIAVALKGTVK